MKEETKLSNEEIAQILPYFGTVIRMSQNDEELDCIDYMILTLEPADIDERDSFRAIVANAMLQFSESRTIAFSEWVAYNAWYHDRVDPFRWKQTEDDEGISTSELFKLFKNDIDNP